MKKLLLALAAGILGFCCVFFITAKQTPAPAPRSNAPLSATHKLALQKVNSLTRYNEELPMDDLLDFYEQHFGHPLDAEAFNRLTEQVTTRVIPRIWHRAQEMDPNRPSVSHRAMTRAVERLYPQGLLLNGDVLLFPFSKDLRVIVSEPTQDFFRDTGWHWRWIVQCLEPLQESGATDLKALDVYAAEVLSEFLSVMGIAVVQLAARGTAEGAHIDHAEIDRLIHRIETDPGPSRNSNAEQNLDYAEETRRELLARIKPPMFKEVSGEVGMNFVHRTDPALQLRRQNLEVPMGLTGGGVAAGDYNADGYPDLFLSGDGGGRLYRNVDGKRFEDVTDRHKLGLTGESHAAYFIDYDNDADLDLFVTFSYRSNRLLEHDGQGGFTDVTDAVGLNSGKDITCGALWFDMDNDGLLDLYTAHYGNWPEGAHPIIGSENANAGRNRLYHHSLSNGQHHFEEISVEAGVDDPGWSFCVGALDYNQDGLMDLFSINDFSKSSVYRNLGGLRFADVTEIVHFDASYNGMNFSLMDVNRDGRFEIFVTQMTVLQWGQKYKWPTKDTLTMFNRHNLKTLRIFADTQLYADDDGDGAFEDVLPRYFEKVFMGWAWDASAMDYENDGDLDVLILNGTESDTPTLEGEARQKYVSGRTDLKQHGDQRNVFFMYENGYFYDASEVCSLAYFGNSRSSAFVDYDRDGDQDVIISDFMAPARVYRNEQEAGNNWVRFHLTGTRSSRDAIGARLKLIDGKGRVQHGLVVSQSGFLCQDPMDIHFGLGREDRILRAIVTWPSGTMQTVEDLAVNQVHEIVEPGS